MPLKMIPVGTIIHNVGLKRNGPGIMARAAGTYAQLIQTGETGYAQVRLSSGEVRLVPVDACATIGAVSNPDHQHEMMGKAGRLRWLGIRPTVRGVAMNATDHPHGGGRGKSKGNKHPQSPWGVLAKGGKTRKSPNPFVVKPRPRR
ncbi:translation protein SH3-like domain-containing protein [Cokeromyces recurvatus]|uniref:translation protein SH3-like domain-containing protein n=1 Tax=Cokeromyces recurvatus TaxID=90255 RepID=UPI00222023E9|nr:translation protein SH3-like domain-containing protein [Cokeromyces recurvatus]KAI7906013.1 translation protein SH3-like domain-containing protein [Cokeromyces recurvatus]